MFDMIRRGLALLRAKLRGLDLPPDPDDAPVREPRRSGPGGRHSAIALDEPRDYAPVEAVGGSRNKRS